MARAKRRNTRNTLSPPSRDMCKTWSVGGSYDNTLVFSIGDSVDKAEVKITLMVLPDDNGTVAFISLNNGTGFTIAGELFGSYANHNHQ